MAVVVATRDAEMRPEIARGWAPVLSADGCGLQLCLSAEPGSKTIANLEQNGDLRCDVRLPSTYRSVQIKGTLRELRRADAGGRRPRPRTSRRLRRRCRAGRPAARGRSTVRRAAVRHRDDRDPRALRPDPWRPGGMRAVTEPVALESILPCLQGVIPSPFATCSAGRRRRTSPTCRSCTTSTPSVSRCRASSSTRRAPTSTRTRSRRCAWSIRRRSRSSRSTSQYLHTETDGPTFEAMKANLEAIASQIGHRQVFRLRGVDIHRVVRCALGDERRPRLPSRSPSATSLARLDEFTRRLARATDYDDAARCGLEALDDLFDFTQAILLVADEPGERLFAVADNGYPTSAAGSEVAVRDRRARASRRSAGRWSACRTSRAAASCRRRPARARPAAPLEREIPLPGLADSRRRRGDPLLVRDRLLGVLYLESDQPRALRAAQRADCCASLASHLAAVLGRPRRHGRAARRAGRGAATAGSPVATTSASPVTYYQADDSVFVDDDVRDQGRPGSHPLAAAARARDAPARARSSNRELRLDEPLGLPAGNDNLEARLLVLRKRLAGGDFGMRLERVGRGRLQFRSTGRWCSPRYRRAGRCGSRTTRIGPDRDFIRSRSNLVAAP